MVGRVKALWGSVGGGGGGPTMVAAMIALEPFSRLAGPTFFYPRTHNLSHWDFASLGLIRTPPEASIEGVDFNRSQYLEAAQAAGNNVSYMAYAQAMQKEVDRRGWKRQVAELRRGDVLVWAGSLVHGGMPVKDQNSTRLSMSAHYVDTGESVRWSPLNSHGNMYTFGPKWPLGVSEELFRKAASRYKNHYKHGRPELCATCADLQEHQKK